MRVGLQHERRRSLAEREAAAVAIERAAGLGVEGLERIEAGVGQPAEAVRADRQREWDDAAADGVGGHGYRERARRAGGRERLARPVETERLAHDRGRGRERRPEEP